MAANRVRHLAALVLTAALLAPTATTALQGPSVSGAWAGTLIIKHDGKTEEDYVHVVLKQDGAKVTGTAGPDASHQYRITNGAIVTTNGVVAITFDSVVDSVQ